MIYKAPTSIKNQGAYSDLLVENREIFIPHLYLAPPLGWPRLNFVKVFDVDENRMIGLPYGEKTMTIC